MRRLKLIGIGAGNPEHITLQAINALKQVDVVFLTDKVESSQDLLRARQEICRRFLDGKPYRTVEIKDPERRRVANDYLGAVTAWHEQRATLYGQIFQQHLADDECGAFLVWGDPSLYDSTLRIIEEVITRGTAALEYEVIPGITSLQALTARHKISMNQLGEPVHITTGRRLKSEDLVAGTNLMVMLDGQCAFNALEDKDIHIYWGAFLGTPDEILLSGKLSEVGGQIESVRAQARSQKGWIMDTYLLCKRELPSC